MPNIQRSAVDVYGKQCNRPYTHMHIRGTKEIAKHRTRFYIELLSKIWIKIKNHLHVNFECTHTHWYKVSAVYAQCTRECSLLPFPSFYFSLSLIQSIQTCLLMPSFFFIECYFYSFIRSLLSLLRFHSPILLSFRNAFVGSTRTCHLHIFTYRFWLRSNAHLASYSHYTVLVLPINGK